MNMRIESFKDFAFLPFSIFLTRISPLVKIYRKKTIIYKNNLDEPIRCNKFLPNMFSPIFSRGSKDFAGDQRTSPPVPSWPPILTLPLGGRRQG